MKLDINLLKRQLLSDSLELLLSQTTLVFGGELEKYENPRVENIASGHFQHLSSNYRQRRANLKILLQEKCQKFRGKCEV